MKLRLTLFIILFCFYVQAQFIDTKTINVANGLLSNNVNVTFVDHRGQLFIGSRAGLAVKKGMYFETVAETTKKKFNNIYDILEDPKYGKWIAGYGQGLLYYNGVTTKLFHRNNGLVHNNVRSLFYYKDAIYVGTENGISIISTQNFSIQNPTFSQNKNFLFSVTSFFTVHNKVFATTINDGIYEVTGTELKKVSSLQKTFSSIVFNAKLYVTTDKKLLVLNPKDFSIEKEYPVGNIWKFLPINDTLYFVASGVFETNGGLYRLNNDVLEHLTEKYDIPHTDLKSIAFDKNNYYLYVGTHDNGLVQINLNAPVAKYDAFKQIQSIAAHNKKNYVFHGNGLSILDNHQPLQHIDLATLKKFQLKHSSKYQKHSVIQNHFYPIDYATPAHKIVCYSAQTHKNTLWLATNIGMFSLDLQGTILAYYSIHVFHFTFFKEQLITVVPYAGVRIFNDIEQFKYQYDHDWQNPTIPTEIVSIANADQAVYFASALSGLYEYKNGRFKSLLLDQSFKEAKLKRICSTSSGDLVVVTDFNDVFILDITKDAPRIKQHISHKKIKGSTTFFVNENKGVLYIGTNLGINVFYNNSYFLIDKAQGFTDYNSTTAIHTNQYLMVGTKSGYYTLNKSYFTNKRAFNNKSAITKLYVNNEILPQQPNSKALKLAHTQNNIQLYFTVPNVKYPDKLQFKFRLKENEKWQNLVNENQLALHYLKSGTYIIQLQITDEDTGTVTQQNLLQLTIKPPFYYSFPFILTCILVVTSLGFTSYKRRVMYLKRKQAREMQLIVLQNEQETKQLLFDKQLADVKLQALKSQMNSHFLFNVMSSIQYFIICKDVDNALYYLEQFSKLIRTTLAYSDKKSISLHEEISYLKQYIEIENLRAEHTIVFSIHIDDAIDTHRLKIIPLLLQPFVENAIVHAFPPSILNPEITLFVHKKAESIQIILKDNGVGYQAKKSTTHQSKGISIVQTQLALTQKKLQKPIEISTSSQGTEVTIFLN